MSLAELLLTLLLATPIVAPPKGQTESAEELRARLASIALDAASVATTPGDATLLLAVAEHESGLARDVDLGPCRAGTCDNGTAACMLQIHGDREMRARLFADRKLCFSMGLAALKSSAATCRALPVEERFAVYASGSCSSEAGRKASRELFRYWQRWAQRYRVEVARQGEQKP